MVMTIAQEMQTRNPKWIQHVLEMLAFYSVLKDNYTIVACQLKMERNPDAGFTWLDEM